MSDNIFREKSLKRISSPESLNDYIKVANPGIWVLLIGLIILLLGFLVWGVYGKMDSKISTIGSVDNNVLTVYVKEEDIDSIAKSSIVGVGEKEYEIASIANTPVKLDYEFDDSYLHLANMSSNSWVYKLTCNLNLPDGVYNVDVITERIKPISLLFN